MTHKTPLLSILALLAALLLAGRAPRAAADSTVSALSVSAATLLSVGNPEVLEESSELLVVSVTEAAGVSEVVLRDASTGLLVSLRTAGEAGGALSLAAGQVLEAVSGTAGTLLVRAGEVIAYLPRSLGEGLLHHHRR